MSLAIDRIERMTDTRDLVLPSGYEEQRVQGLLLAPIGDITGRIEQLKRRGITAVVVGRPEYGTPYSSVAMDNVAGGYLATKHLLDLGRRRLGFVGGPVGLRGVEDRLNGSKSAVAEVPGATLEIFARPTRA
jgi:LacI family transcriptional regulator